MPQLSNICFDLSFESFLHLVPIKVTSNLLRIPATTYKICQGKLKQKYN